MRDVCLAAARVMLLVSSVAAAACSPIASRSLTFDFAGQLLPTDVARPMVPITNTSSWLPPDSRARLRMSTAAGALAGPTRTAIARAIVEGVVRDGLATLCSAPLPPPAPDAMVAYTSLCDPTTGGARPFCVGIDRLSVSAYGGNSEVVDPPPLAAACGTSDATTTERGTVLTSGFSLAYGGAPLFTVPLAPPGASSTFVTFRLTVPRPLPTGVIRSADVLYSPTSVPAEWRLLPPSGATDCVVRGAPGTLMDCTFMVAVGPWSNTLAPRDLTLVVVLQAVVDGVLRSVPLFASVQLAVRAGTPSFVGCLPSSTRDGQTTHRLQFSITGGSVYVDGGFVVDSSVLEPVSSARVVVPGGPGSVRLDVGSTFVDVVEPSPLPSSGTVFDGRHSLALETVDGQMRGSVFVPLPEGC